MQVGGRNLIINSKINETSNNYGFGYRNVVALENNTTYTFTVNGRSNPSGNTEGKHLRCYIYENSWRIFNFYFGISETVNTTRSYTFTTPSNVAGIPFRVAFYWFPAGGDRTGNATVNWCKLEKGNKATDWTPAPEDVEADISKVDEKFVNYSTTTQMHNAISQAVSAESNSIKSEISRTYVTSDMLSDSLSGIDESIGKLQEDQMYYTKTEQLDNYIKQLIENDSTETSIVLKGEYTTQDSLGNTLKSYATTTQMNNAITQAITTESNSIRLEVSGTYATKTDINNLQIGGVNRFIKSTVTPNKYITATGIITDGGNYWDLTDYIDVSKWTNYVASGWTNLGNAPATCFFDSNKKFISGVADKSTGARGSLPVPSNATYMRFSFAHVDTDKLKIEKGTKATDYSPAPEDVNAKFNNYATTASLDLYIKKDPTSGELKSAIEAIADDITLNASGTINISGNKSVNINGNLFTLTTTNTTISADGTIRCDNLISSNATITGGSINIETSTSTYSAIKLSYGDAYLKESPYSIEMHNPTLETYNNIDAHGVSIIGNDNVLINAITDFGVEIRKGVLYVESEATVRFETDCNNISIWNPSLSRRCHPAMYTNNPVTFDWDGSVLRIYVDNTIVASWIWGEQRWE